MLKIYKDKLIMRIININADRTGILSASVCLIHCLVTPFIIMLFAASEFWHFGEYIFAAISFFAVYQASKNKPGKFIAVILWVSCVILITAIMIKSTFEQAQYFTYLGGFGLISGHLLNIRNCNKCEVSNKE